MTKPKYDSSRDRENYTFHPGRIFHLEWTEEPGDCYLFALNDRQTSLLRKMLQVFPKYHWVWGLPSPRKEWDAATWQLWNDISEFVDELEACLVSGCDVNELNKSIRQLTAVLGGQVVDLTQPIPDEIDYSGVGVGVLPTLNEHLSSLGPIPKAGDTIMTSLQKLTAHMDTLPEDLALGLGGGSTIQDLIDTLENTDFSSVGLLGNVKDLLEILLFLKLLFGPTMPTTIAFTYWDSIKMGRWQHNNLTLQAYQAIALRGIQHGITPFEDGDGIKSDEEILADLETVPWLAKMAARYITGSPISQLESYSWILGPVSEKIYEFIRDTWNYWYEQYINIVGTPTPARTLTGVLTQISRKLVWDQGDQGETVIDFSDKNLGTRLKQIADKLASDGVTLEEVISQLELTAEAPIVNITNDVNVTCSACGCEGEQPPTGGGIIEGDPPPDGWEPPTDPDTGEEITPGSPAYQNRKCKVANLLWEELRELLVEFAAKDVPATVGLGAGAILLVVTQIVKVAVVAAGAGPIGIAVVLVIGGLSGLILAFYGSTLDLSRMIQILDDYQEDLVCALYNASSTEQGQADFRQIMDDNGAQPGDLALYDALMIADAVGTLFYRMIGDPGDQLEATLDGYTGTVDCSGCPGVLFPFDFDLNGWTLQTLPASFPRQYVTLNGQASQAVEWELWENDGSLSARAEIDEFCCVASPVIGVNITANSRLVWDRDATNVTYELVLEFSDASIDSVESQAAGYPDGSTTINISANAGKTLTRIWLSFGGQDTPRRFRIKMLDIEEV